VLGVIFTAFAVFFPPVGCREAAAQGNEGAQTNLGTAYSVGMGVAKVHACTAFADSKLLLALYFYQTQASCQLLSWALLFCFRTLLNRCGGGGRPRRRAAPRPNRA